MEIKEIKVTEPRFIKIPSEETLRQLLRQGLNEAKISQRKLAEILETDQASISRKLTGKRSFRLEEISAITSIILEQISSMPPKTISDAQMYVSSPNLVYVYTDDVVSEAARKMKNGSFTQLPVVDKERGECIGIVTDFTLLKRMISPTTPSKEKWLNELKKMKIRDAGVIDAVPTFPLNSSIIEIAQALMYHYAVLISEGKGKFGIVTRADFLRLLM